MPEKSETSWVTECKSGRGRLPEGAVWDKKSEERIMMMCVEYYLKTRRENKYFLQSKQLF
jgi:hypothetical protein